MLYPAQGTPAGHAQACHCATLSKFCNGTGAIEHLRVGPGYDSNKARTSASFAPLARRREPGERAGAGREVSRRRDTPRRGFQSADSAEMCGTRIEPPPSLPTPERTTRRIAAASPSAGTACVFARCPRDCWSCRSADCCFVGHRNSGVLVLREQWRPLLEGVRPAARRMRQVVFSATVNPQGGPPGHI